jgi:hypothetical protein
LNEDLIEELLYRSEGVDLDFKRTQYPFANAKDEDKRAELLKDILAMANSWRDRTAYILLGFQEDKPNLPVTTGIEEHLDDASIQQFINSKVEPPVEFRYEELTYREKHIGVISIPKQSRPFYVKKTYGKVHSNVVYVRRGSSTAEAEPPEIVRMTSTDAGALRAPAVELTLVDGKGESAPSKCSLQRFDFGEIRDLPDLESPRTIGPYGISPDYFFQVNSSYWRDLAYYVQDMAGSVRLRLRLINHSSFALSDCKLKVSGTVASRDVALKTGSKLAERPARQSNLLRNIRTFSDVTDQRARQAEFYIEKDVGRQSLVILIPKILPGETFTATQYLALFPNVSGELVLAAILYATELSVPIVLKTSLDVEVEERVGDVDFLEKRFK